MTERHDKILAKADFNDATRYFMLQVTVILSLTIFGVLLLPIVLPIIYISKRIEYRYIECTLLSRTLKVRRGWLNKTENTIPLDKITDLSVRQSLIMRWAGVEALTVETAGQSNTTGGALVQLVGIRGAREFRDTVLKQRDLLAGHTDDNQGGAPHPRTNLAAATADTAELLPTLDAIHDTLLRIEQRLDNDRHR